MPINMDDWDPPEQVAPNYDDEPKMADLVNNVMAMIGPHAPEDYVSEKFGERQLVRLDHLVVFNSQGQIAGVYDDYAVFQNSLFGQLEGATIRVGRLKRPGQRYELVPTPKLKPRVRDALIAADLIGDDDGLPSRHERQVKAEAATRPVDDDDGF